MQGATGHGVPVIGYIEGLGFMRYNPKNLELDKEPKFFNLPLESKIQYPFVQSLYYQQRIAFSEFESVIVLSEFLKSTIKATFDVDSTLLRTTVDLDAFQAEDWNPEYIAMINPRTELKGASIFLNIVRRMSDQQFLVAGEFDSEKSRRTAAELDNLEHRGWVEDMREVYSETKLLLVPSLVEEGGPRVIVEAFANGIPVVGTDRGGTGEFIDNAGAVVDDPHDISLWEQNIESAIDCYAELSAVATERAELFDASQNADQFERVIKCAVDDNG
jgi:glycosyltransferase involved in cell wall biosynthesis